MDDAPRREGRAEPPCPSVLEAGFESTRTDRASAEEAGELLTRRKFEPASDDSNEAPTALLTAASDEEVSRGIFVCLDFEG